MKLHNLATAGLVTSILSILAGAIVRATGSGDGCGHLGQLVMEE